MREDHTDEGVLLS